MRNGMNSRLFAGGLTFDGAGQLADALSGTEFAQFMLHRNPIFSATGKTLLFELG